MKIALMPGHARESEGAVACAGYFEGLGEHAVAEFYLPTLGACLVDMGYEVVQTEREDAGGTTPLYSAKAANNAGADLALEWHFNSAGSGVGGCEVLYWGGSVQGKEFATLLSARLAKILGVKNRGAKAVCDVADRGYYAFARSRMPFFMVEPCFAGSNADEARAFGEAILHGAWAEKVARAIHEIMEEVYKKGN